MDERKLKLVIGSLLHDIGKLCYRHDDGRNHSLSGYEFLQSTGLKEDADICQCARYHHAKQLKNASLAEDAICYITYIADNMAAFADRREKEDDAGNGGFVKDIAPESIFNILNHNKQGYVYKPSVLAAESPIQYPIDPKKTEIYFSEKFYGDILVQLRELLGGVYFTREYINSLLEILEANWTFIPSSTQTGELRDISLFDHAKITAAIALCIYDYFSEKGISDYHQALYQNGREFYHEKAFLIYSMDISGIQEFIYTAENKDKPLKGLRARSLYLEILMESTVDYFMESLELCRTNVLYTGGGHAYLLLPATEKVKQILVELEKQLNRWFLDTYKIALYIGGGYCECSGNDLKNEPQGSYENIFQTVSRKISAKKLTRYDKEELLYLNFRNKEKNERECKVCLRTDLLNADNKCEICDNLGMLAQNVLSSEFFVILKDKPHDNRGCLPLPFGHYMVMSDKNALLAEMKSQQNYVRAYSKNKQYTGVSLASKLWVGDYAKKESFEELAAEALGIERLAVLRADVDNLGQAFVSGFQNDSGNRYVTISRTAVFSRNMALFFKLHINHLLSKGSYYLQNNSGQKERNAVIVYSGGDDVFVVGSWDDMIGFAVDLYHSLKQFTQGTLTCSAGIGLFTPDYPISAMAKETGALEEISKGYKYPDKNAVTLFDAENCYGWEDFINYVLEEKLAALREFFDGNEEKGGALLYHLLDYIRKREEEERLNIARFAYLLARLRPDPEKAEEAEMKRYQKFSEKMYRWIQNETDSKQLITAIYIYAYMRRKKEER